MAIRNDEELNKLMGDITVAAGGVIPNISAVPPSLLALSTSSFFSLYKAVIFALIHGLTLSVGPPPESGR